MKSKTKNLAKATITPLASIFGSGFLVIIPILAAAVGIYSVYAMAVVCVVAYGVGSVIRFNIKNVEPLLDSDTARARTKHYNNTSDLALIIAYVISVCLYINILASFLLRGIGEQYDTPVNEHHVTAAIIAFIAFVGYFKGLKALAKLEAYALCVTMLIIIALFIGFASYDIKTILNGTLQLPNKPSHSLWQIITIVGGTLIVVQGFETSRYLGVAFDTSTRIKSCRLSQIISTIVYLIFIALAIPLIHFLGNTVKDNDLIMLAGKASVILTVPLVISAVLSQFSAAVADTFGGSGNIVELTNNRTTLKHATLLICGGAMALCALPTLTILAIASRAFAFYYMLQCLVANTIAKSKLQHIFFLSLAAILAFITIFAVPAG